MNDDTITRARAAVARLREAEGAWLGALSVYPENGMSNDADDLAERICDTRDDFVDALLPYAAPALLRLAEACTLWATPMIDDLPWWCDLYDEFLPNCKGCGACGETIGKTGGSPDPTTVDHAPDCPALAIDAALTALAALDAGEVGE